MTTLTPVIIMMLLVAQAAQPAAWTPSLNRLSSAAARLSGVPIDVPPADRVRLLAYSDRIKKDVETIRTTAKSVTDAFQKSLDMDGDALDSVTREPSPAARVLTVSAAVADDLTVKAGYVVAQKGNVKDVRVDAWTKLSAAVRNGCEVWYTPSAYRDDATKHKRFAKVSSPTTELVAPGGYVMWSRFGAALGEREPVDIGKEGRDPNSVDLPVPAAASDCR
jgi:hypothetical protein